MVPSIGSITQRTPVADSAFAPSSERIPSPGRAARIPSTISRSQASSTSVTTSVPVDFVRTSERGSRRRSSESAPALSASSTASASSSRGSASTAQVSPLAAARRARAPLLASEPDGHRHDQLRPRRPERRHPPGRGRARGDRALARERLGARPLLWHRDRPPRPLRVGRSRVPRGRGRAGDVHQRLDGGRRAALPLHGRARRPGDRRTALLRPHPAAPRPHRRRDRRRSAGGRRDPARGVRGGARRRPGEARPRDPELPQPGGLHALGDEARAPGRARGRARLLDLRGRPLPAGLVRRRAAADDAVARSLRAGDPRLLVLEDGQPGRSGRLPRRSRGAGPDPREARFRALHLAQHAGRVDGPRALHAPAPSPATSSS